LNDLPEIDEKTRTIIEAAVFRKMIGHFRKHADVQNIDLMNLAYFCRNCFSKWYMGAAKDQGIEMDYDQAREIVYGMPFEEYKSKHQLKATEDQLEQFKHSQKKATD